MTGLDLVRMKQVNIHEAKTHFSRLVEEAAKGKEIVIARAGKPVARLVPLKSAKRRKRIGVLKGQFLRIGDDFDAPLPPELAEPFGA